MIVRMLCAVIVVTFAFVLPASSWAQCRADTECKGERVCEEGRCKAPDPIVSPDWAWGGAGLLFMLSTFSVSVDATAGIVGALDEDPGEAFLWTVGVGLALKVIGVSIAAFSVDSALEISPEIKGSPTSRYLGWAGLGLGVLSGAGALTYGAIAGLDHPAFPTTLAFAAAVFGGAGLLLLSFDSFVASEEARSFLKNNPDVYDKLRSIHLGPTLVRDPASQSLQVGLGFDWRF